MPAAAKLKKIDPKWAWAPYQPEGARPWNLRRVAHLYRRAGFGADWGQLNAAVEAGFKPTIAALFDAQPSVTDVAADDPAPAKVDAFDRKMDRLGRTMMAANDPRQLSAWWLYRMLMTPDQLTEKMTLFWHGHFATSAQKVTKAKLMLDQNALLREHALGAFEPLVKAMSRDVAMLVWLDSTSNRKIHPNENYAREIMELFCLGLDNYTEQDIREVARAFTGWEVRGDRFRFNRYQHDDGVKRFLGEAGNFDGDDAVRIILQQPAAARFIARKLARYLVADEPELPAELIEPLAAELRSNGFEIGPVVRRIVSSNLFYSDHAMGRKVRSPVELGVGLLRSLEATADSFFLAQRLDELGHAVFYPPNVKGWDGGRTWINSSSLLGRANLVHDLVHEQIRFRSGGTFADLAARHAMTSPEQRVDWLLTLLVAVDPPAEARAALIDLAADSAGDDSAMLARLTHAISALPEFHLA